MLAVMLERVNQFLHADAEAFDEPAGNAERLSTYQGGASCQPTTRSDPKIDVSNRRMGFSWAGSGPAKERESVLSEVCRREKLQGVLPRREAHTPLAASVDAPSTTEIFTWVGHAC